MESIPSDEDDALLRDLDLFSLPIISSPNLSPSFLTSPSYSSTPKKTPCETAVVSPHCGIEISTTVTCSEKKESDQSDPSTSQTNSLSLDSAPNVEKREEVTSCPSLYPPDEEKIDDWECYVAFSKFFVSSYFGPSTPEKVKQQRTYIPEAEWLKEWKPFSKQPSLVTNENESENRDQTKSSLDGAHLLARDILLQESEERRPEITEENDISAYKNKDDIEERIDRKEMEEHSHRDTNREKNQGVARKILKNFEGESDFNFRSSFKSRECKRGDGLENRDFKVRSVRFSIPGKSSNDAVSGDEENVDENNRERSPSCISRKYFHHSIPNWNSIRNPTIHEDPKYIRLKGLLHLINYIKIICPFGLTTIFRLIKIFINEPYISEEEDERTDKGATFFIRMSKTRAFKFVVHTEIWLPSNLRWNRIQNLSDNSILYFIAVNEEIESPCY